jgi:AcrR family transcriptional regulator
MQIRKDVETRKEEVFEVIAQIIAEEGCNYVSTKTVAQKLGVSQPALYKYFKNREEMVIGFLDYLTALLIEVLARVNSFETSEEKLHAFYQEQLALIEKTKVLPKVLFFEELHLDRGEKRDKLRDMVHIYEEGIKQFVVEGIARQEIIEVDPNTAVQFIKGPILVAYLNWSLAGRNYSLVAEKDKFMTFLKQTILRVPVKARG